MPNELHQAVEEWQKLQAAGTPALAPGGSELHQAVLQSQQRQRAFPPQPPREQDRLRGKDLLTGFKAMEVPNLAERFVGVVGGAARAVGESTVDLAKRTYRSALVLKPEDPRAMALGPMVGPIGAKALDVLIAPEKQKFTPDEMALSLYESALDAATLAASFGLGKLVPKAGVLPRGSGVWARFINSFTPRNAAIRATQGGAVGLNPLFAGTNEPTVGERVEQAMLFGTFAALLEPPIALPFRAGAAFAERRFFSNPALLRELRQGLDTLNPSQLLRSTFPRLNRRLAAVSDTLSAVRRDLLEPIEKQLVDKNGRPLMGAARKSRFDRLYQEQARTVVPNLREALLEELGFAKGMLGILIRPIAAGLKNLKVPGKIREAGIQRDALKAVESEVNRALVGIQTGKMHYNSYNALVKLNREVGALVKQFALTDAHLSAPAPIESLKVLFGMAEGPKGAAFVHVMRNNLFGYLSLVQDTIGNLLRIGTEVVERPTLDIVDAFMGQSSQFIRTRALGRAAQEKLRAVGVTIAGARPVQRLVTGGEGGFLKVSGSQFITKLNQEEKAAITELMRVEEQLAVRESPALLDRGVVLRQKLAAGIKRQEKGIGEAEVGETIERMKAHLTRGIEGAVGTRPGATVRLYHGEGGPEGAGSSGLFFSADPKRAASFGGEVTAVDVPANVYQAGRLEARRLGTGTKTDAVLPRPYADRAKPVKVKPDTLFLKGGTVGAAQIRPVGRMTREQEYAATLNRIRNRNLTDDFVNRHVKSFYAGGELVGEGAPGLTKLEKVLDVVLFGGVKGKSIADTAARRFGARIKLFDEAYAASAGLTGAERDLAIRKFLSGEIPGPVAQRVIEFSNQMAFVIPRGPRFTRFADNAWTQLLLSPFVRFGTAWAEFIAEFVPILGSVPAARRELFLNTGKMPVDAFSRAIVKQVSGIGALNAYDQTKYRDIEFTDIGLFYVDPATQRRRRLFSPETDMVMFLAAIHGEPDKFAQAFENSGIVFLGGGLLGKLPFVLFPTEAAKRNLNRDVARVFDNLFPGRAFLALLNDAMVDSVEDPITAGGSVALGAKVVPGQRAVLGVGGKPGIEVLPRTQPTIATGAGTRTSRPFLLGTDVPIPRSLGSYVTEEQLTAVERVQEFVRKRTGDKVDFRGTTDFIRPGGGVGAPVPWKQVDERVRRYWFIQKQAYLAAALSGLDESPLWRSSNNELMVATLRYHNDQANKVATQMAEEVFAAQLQADGNIK